MLSHKKDKKPSDVVAEVSVSLALFRACSHEAAQAKRLLLF